MIARVIVVLSMLALPALVQAGATHKQEQQVQQTTTASTATGVEKTKSNLPPASAPTHPEMSPPEQRDLPKNDTTGEPPAETSLLGQWNTPITAIATLLAAIIGAWVGGKSTLKAAEKSFQHQEMVRKHTARETEKALLEAVQGELDALLKQYSKMIGDTLEQHPDNTPFKHHFPLYGEYFTVYDANAANIGLVRDSDLRDCIIAAYLAAKGLVDSYKYNNELVRQADEALRLSALGQGSGKLIGHTADQLKDYSSELKNDHYMTKNAMLDALEKIKQKLEANDYWHT